MIEQYLSNKNKNTTVPKIQNFCQLNKAWVQLVYYMPPVDIVKQQNRDKHCLCRWTILNKALFSSPKN